MKYHNNSRNNLLKCITFASLSLYAKESEVISRRHLTVPTRLFLALPPQKREPNIIFRCNRYKHRIRNNLPIQQTMPEHDRYKDSLLNKTIREMTLSELREAKKYALKIQADKHLIIQYIERMILLSTDQHELQNIKFELADLYFNISDMKKAGKLFREYVKLYPGCSKRDEAEYKEILSRFHARLLPPRDQSKTQKVLHLANNYLHTTAIKRSHILEVQDIQKTCFTDLFSHEFDIAHQYMIRKQYMGTQTRIQYIKNELIQHVPEKEAQLLELEIALDQARLPQDNPENVALIKQKIAQLSTRWPHHQPTLIASYEKPKRNAVSHL